MALFGPPDIEKLTRKGDVAGLIKALDHEDTNVIYPAGQALRTLGVAAVEPMIAALGRPGDPRTRGLLALALGDSGDQRAFEPLVAALRDESEDLRGPAAMALGRFGDPRAFEPLLAVLGDADAGVRAAVVTSLGQIGDPRALEPLATALAKDESLVQGWAASALRNLGDPAAVEPLIEALGDPDKGVRWSAAEALAGFHDPAAVGALRAALLDPEPSVSERAGIALQALGESPEPEPAAATGGDTRAEVQCARCDASFDWEGSYWHQDTAGSSDANPPGHGTFRPRAYCPSCGELVAEWHIDSIRDYDEWAWFGENAGANAGAELPPSPLQVWGKEIPLDLQPPFEAHRIELEKLPTHS